ncbi:hypothetical protein NAEGRDRAFT_80615 [Naegleria gruberi]|uniref:Uncharacterized protein AM10 n=1 Tax=Naegleria gruberi TaxID=5762 RepID=D2VN56_NAEGR|nr:uncharacterized protein NAEGRDRAFT_80615 [Naegleria gruberi]EFC41685.1 hypothetical protein NAEGRDRAFT_80615 [Naegleria gruberi]|eukprot:XP_002674429.1 hypothetical protein NAEGRDRAFT_80615 [Naegleria gruberi strain NEG-M]
MSSTTDASVERYRDFIASLISSASYARALSEVSSSSDIDFLAKILLDIANATNRSQQLIKELIYFEISKYQHMPTTIFRSNSLASKALGLYVRDVGYQYLKNTIGTLCDDLIVDAKSLEIDPKALEEEKDPEKKLQQNIERLTEWSAKFLDRMMSADVIDKMPKELRLIARFIGQVSDSLQLDTPVLIGGYIMLRFFNPAIATPDAMNLTTKKKTKVSQRNFILITKVIQNLANNVLFGNKERFMICMNDFLTQKKDIMREYLMSIIDYSEKVDESSELYTKDESGNLPFERKSELNTTVDPKALDMSKFEKRDLDKLYKLFFEYSPQVVEFFLEEGITKEIKPICKVMNGCLEVVDITEKLGEPISSMPIMTPSPTPQNDDEDTVLDNVTLQIEKIFSKICLQVWKHTTKIDGSAIESKFFFYRGNNILTTFEEKLLVYYMIGTRLKDLDFLQDGLGEILFHFIKVLRPSLENIRPPSVKTDIEKYSKKFMLILDMSFISMSEEQEKVLATLLHKFSRLFTLAQQKQIYQTVVLHAPNMITFPSFLIKHFAKTKMASTPKKQKDYAKKIVMMEDYSKLLAHGFRREEDILIPEVSKFNVPKTYKIIKVNPKGKHQERLLKVTMMSLLNIDPKSKAIKNERLLSEIEEISAPPSNLEIHMRFRPITPKTDQPIPYFPDNLDDDDTDDETPMNGKKKKKSEVGFRRYIVNSEQEREAVLEEIFETVVRSQYCTTYQSFNSLLYKGTSKKAKRLIKLTADSMLEVSGRTIKNEFPFIGIEYCRLTSASPLAELDNFDNEEEETDLLTLLASSNQSASTTVAAANNSKEKPIVHKDMVSLKMKNEEGEHFFIITSTGLGQESDTHTYALEFIKAIEEGVKRTKDIITQRSLSEPEFTYDTTGVGDMCMKSAENKSSDNVESKQETE